MNFRKLLLFFVLLLSGIPVVGQISNKLSPNETIKIIGTRYSVNYDNDQRTETVNTKADAFDGKMNTFFASFDRSNTWVGLDLGEKHVITKVAYCPRQSNEDRLVLGMFEGANNPDFGDAVPLGLVAVQPVYNRMTELTVQNSRGFRYVRYVGPHDKRCNIAELAFYGYANPGSDSKLTQITNIPDVIIHTVNAADITSKTRYIKGIVSFVSENGTQIYTDSLEIRGRGNASWGFEKKPYRMKLKTKTKLLGNPAEARNWTLISNHGDKTLIRNLMAFELSKRLEMPYTPAGQLVNVYLNGEYKGCYQLCDQIDVRENRVDVKEMKKTDIAGEALTGGYLIEIDAYSYDEPNRFNSTRGIPVTIKSPDSEDATTQQNTYIRNHFNKFETSVFSGTYTSPTTGFRMYMDTKTFVRHFLVGEISGNTDTYWSVYMYKQRNDNKFYFGPVWDFDIAFENDNRTYPINNKSNWIYVSGGSAAGSTATLVSRLLTDKVLYKELQDTYAEYRDKGIITAEKLVAVVDNYVKEIDQSQQLNFKRWNILNQRIHQNFQALGSYSAEVEFLKKYIRARIVWMDKKLNYVPNPTYIEALPSLSFTVQTQANSIHVGGINEPVSIEVFDITGNRVSKVVTGTDTSILSRKGVYVVRILPSNGESSTVIKCIVE
ncbi:hypothetical protein FACS1894123_10520 [Bacteroidia bacterium]|nr:hypothetical protein FACS1894123_10520 [Bacteroidia bacterium]